MRVPDPPRPATLHTPRPRHPTPPNTSTSAGAPASRLRAAPPSAPGSAPRASSRSRCCGPENAPLRATKGAAGVSGSHVPIIPHTGSHTLPSPVTCSGTMHKASLPATRMRCSGLANPTAHTHAHLEWEARRSVSARASSRGRAPRPATRSSSAGSRPPAARAEASASGASAWVSSMTTAPSTACCGRCGHYRSATKKSRHPTPPHLPTHRKHS